MMSHLSVKYSRANKTLHSTANALIAQDPMALLIGFALDQQVSVQKAFTSPLELKRRLGSLDAADIAGRDPGELERVFREKPALHRFPGNMARRTQELCAAIVSDAVARMNAAAMNGRRMMTSL